MDFKGLIKPENINWINGLPIAVEIYSVSSMSPRIHNGVLEIVICLEGECDFTFAFEQHRFEKGDFLSVDEDAFSLQNGKNCICASIYFDLQRFIDRYPLINYTLFACEGTKKNKYVAKYNKLKGLILSFLCYLSKNSQWDDNVLTEYANALIDVMVLQFNLPSYHIGGEEVSLDNFIRLLNVNKYIIDGVNEGYNIGLEDVAARLSLTPGYVSEFLRGYRFGFRDMISYTRAAKAEKYLMSGDYAMVDISEECGFSDAKYFYKAFRKWHNMGPREFREKYREMSKMEESIRELNIHDELILKYIEAEMYEHYLLYFAP